MVRNLADAATKTENIQVDANVSNEGRYKRNKP